MFNIESNDMFSFTVLPLQKCSMRVKPRHPSLERLLEFVKDRGIVGPSALAFAMQETDQVITNWGRRGVSKSGAMKAEEKFGCSGVWVLKGQVRQEFATNPPSVTALLANDVATIGAPSLAQSIQVLAESMMGMDATTRRRAGRLLAELADDPMTHAQITQMLEAAIRSGQSESIEPSEEEKKFIYKKQHPVEPWSPMTADRRIQKRREA